MMPPWLVPVTVAGVVGGIPVVMVTVVLMPEEWSPGMPVDRVVTPVPVGAPYGVVRIVHVPYHRPGCHLIVGGGNNRHIVPLYGPAVVTGVGCLRVDRFHNVILSVKSLVTYQLYLHLAVAKLLNSEDSHILVFVAVKDRTEDDGVHVAIDIIRYGQVINISVSVKVEVVYPGFLIVETFFKGFKRLRLLEKLHDCIEVQVVTRETQVFLRIILSSG